jgi:hypothetical protein
MTREWSPPPNRVGRCSGDREHHLDERAVMVAFAMHLLRTTSTQEVHRQSRGTRQTVEKVGITQFSTGNMRKAYEFFGVEPYSKCEKLAEKVQEWSEKIYRRAKKECRHA